MKRLKLYRVYTHTTPDGMIYIGLSHQRYIKNRWRAVLYEKTSLGDDINLWGWENIKHDVVFETDDRSEAYEYENNLIMFCDINGVLINKYRSGLHRSKKDMSYTIFKKVQHWNEVNGTDYSPTEAMYDFIMTGNIPGYVNLNGLFDLIQHDRPCEELF